MELPNRTVEVSVSDTPFLSYLFSTNNHNTNYYESASSVPGESVYYFDFEKDDIPVFALNTLVQKYKDEEKIRLSTLRALRTNTDVWYFPSIMKPVSPKNYYFYKELQDFYRTDRNPVSLIKYYKNNYSELDWEVHMPKKFFVDVDELMNSFRNTNSKSKLFNYGDSHFNYCVFLKKECFSEFENAVKNMSLLNNDTGPCPTIILETSWFYFAYCEEGEGHLLKGISDTKLIGSNSDSNFVIESREVNKIALTFKRLMQWACLTQNFADYVNCPNLQDYGKESRKFISSLANSI